MKNTPWKVVKSRYIVDDQWMKLRADECRTPDGHIVSPYYVLEYPTWVNVIALTPDKEVVLIRQYRHGIRQFITEIPGGAVSKDDPTIVHAVRRELLEETGYEVKEVIETGSMSANPVNHTNKVHFHLAFDAEKTSEQTLELTEQIKVFLLPWNEFVERAYKGELSHPDHIASVFFALKVLKRV
jgi:8-oxo-dGTP pyrophosphatase MutT (NUDIX family)